LIGWFLVGWFLVGWFLVDSADQFFQGADFFLTQRHGAWKVCLWGRRRGDDSRGICWWL
jgi:hypothetical protein